MCAVFGGVHHLTAPGRPKAGAPPGGSPEYVPPVDVGDAVSAMADHAHKFVETAPGMPLALDSLDVHGRAAEQALNQLLLDRPVTAAVDPSLFAPDPARQAERAKIDAAATEALPATVTGTDLTTAELPLHDMTLAELEAVQAQQSGQWETLSDQLFGADAARYRVNIR